MVALRGRTQAQGSKKGGPSQGQPQESSLEETSPIANGCDLPDSTDLYWKDVYYCINGHMSETKDICDAYNNLPREVRRQETSDG